MRCKNIVHRSMIFVMLLYNLFGLSGCVGVAKVKGISPTYPSQAMMSNKLVDSLQPLIMWEGDQSRKFDLAIWSTVKVGYEWRPYKIIYEKTNISGTSHKVEIVLTENTAYRWSVREMGSKNWSTLDESVAVLNVSSISRGELFFLVTPKISIQKTVETKTD